MSAKDDQQHDQDPLPLPEGARTVLRQRGERLLSELGAMRQGEAAAGSLPIEPLDPQAELALRRRGDELLAELERQRAGIESAEASAPRGIQRSWRPWAGVAAALVALAAAVQMAIPLASPTPTTPATPAASDPATGSSGGQWSTQLPLAPPSIPEPNSALLTLFSAVIWLSRRRR